MDLATRAATTASLFRSSPSSSATTGCASGIPDSWHVVHRASRSSSGLVLSGLRPRYISR